MGISLYNSISETTILISMGLAIMRGSVTLSFSHIHSVTSNSVLFVRYKRCKFVDIDGTIGLEKYL